VTLFLEVVHVLVCLILVGAVLLQRGKGAEIGAVFGGGGSSTIFGSRGAGNFLSRLTTGAAVVFFGTSLWLSILASGHRGSVFGDSPPPAPAGAPAAGGFEEVKPKAAAEPTAPTGAPAPEAASPAEPKSGPAAAVEKPAAATEKSAAAEKPQTKPAAPANKPGKKSTAPAEKHGGKSAH
jgi:preprotein translocase subunit SecG